MRQRAVVLWLAVLLTFALAACGGGRADPAPVPPAAEPAPAAPTAPLPAADAEPAAAEEPAPAAPATPVAGEGSRYVIVGSESTAAYAVKEQFANRDLPNDAVGSTAAVEGFLVLGPAGFGASRVQVDLTTLKSDEARRDNFVRDRALQTSRYPIAEFAITGSDGPVPTPDSAEPVSFGLRGVLHIRDTELPVVWEARAALQDGRLTLSAETQFALTDVGIQPPSVMGMLTSEDLVRLSVDLVATATP